MTCLASPQASSVILPPIASILDLPEAQFDARQMAFDNLLNDGYNAPCSASRAGVAQPVEQPPCKWQVVGSIPTASLESWVLDPSAGSGQVF